MEGFQVEPESMRTAAQRLQQVGEKIAQEWQSFASGIQSRGDVFGDDPVGGLIAASYQAAHQLAENCYTSSVQAFGSFGTGLTQMATNYEQTEQQITEMLNKLKAALG
jgi:uncharacterized protein YukE